MATISFPDEHGLQPFFVMHKAPQPSQSSGKSRRKMNSYEKASLKPCDSRDEALNGLEQRLQLFRVLWSNIESTIKDVMTNINCSVFDSLSSWIRESCGINYSVVLPDPTVATKTYPILLSPNYSASSKQLPTAVVVTDNMEFVDDIQTFGNLAEHLKSCGYHVASLTSLDLSTKSGVVGCLKSLLKQLLTISTDAADISILASWYTEQGSHENPVVLIIDSVERCNRSVLSDMIVLLSEWTSKIPIVLVLGITTTADALSDILPSNVLQHLSPFQFILQSPTKRMDAIIASLFVRPRSCFCLGHNVATFLRNNFLTQDGTLTAFIRALKIAGVLHFILDLPSFDGSAEETCTHDLSTMNIGLLQERLIKQTFDLPPRQRDDQIGPNDEFWADGLSELQRMYDGWSSFIKCLSEAGKYQNLKMLDLFCAVLEPHIRKSNKDGDQSQLGYSHRITTSTCCFSKPQPCSQKCKPLCLTISIIRDLPDLELYQLLKKWEQHTAQLGEPHKKIKELLSLMASDSRIFSDTGSINIAKKRKTENNVHVEKGKIKFNEKATELATSLVRAFGPLTCNQILLVVHRSFSSLKVNHMNFVDHEITLQSLQNYNYSNIYVKFASLPHCRKKLSAHNATKGWHHIESTLCKDHMQPIESIPLHEIVCFKNVVKLQSGLIGEPRKRAQIDLLESQNFLKCQCCRQKGSCSSSSTPLPSVHDTSTMYSLCLEHGNLINVHDLFEAFKARILQSDTKSKNRSKKKSSKEAQTISDASIQARFCRGIIELQITGLLRTPSKRRPDYVQSIAFGV